MDLEERIKELLGIFTISEVLEMNNITEEEVLEFLFNNGLISLETSEVDDLDDES